MRKVVLVLVHVLVAMIVTVTAFANSHMEMKPNAKLRELDFLTGNWSCKGTAFANPMSAEHPTEAKVNAKWEGGGYWAAYSYTETKTAMNAMPFWVSGFMGYDAEKKMLVNISVDNMGGSGWGSSAGWSGDTLTFEGTWQMMGMTSKSRDTFMKKNDNTMVHSAYVEAEGKWMKMDEETCTRAK
jgi:hypothetical protein